MIPEKCATPRCDGTLPCTARLRDACRQGREATEQRAGECRESWAPEREANPDTFLSMLPLADA